MREQPPSGVPGPVVDAGHGDVPPDEVPEVADAVGARALGLRRIAEQLRDAGGPAGPDLAGALRAHAGDVDALADHLRDAGVSDAPPAGTAT